MKAAVYKRYGTPDVLHVEDVPMPEPKDHEVLVAVHASTVNRTDTGFRSAQYVISRFFTGLLRPKNTIVGTEYAGEIVQIGKSVINFKIGDHVFGYNEKTFGACAEFLAISEESMVAVIPYEMPFTEAACCTEGFHYALNYINAAKITSEDNVLVYGATGSIGSAAVQILAARNTKVTAVCSAKNFDLVRTLGANAVIDYHDQDWQESLAKVPKTYDVILDAVGKLTFGSCKQILKPQGIYMSSEFGPWLQNPVLTLWTKFFSKQKVLFPIPAERKQDILYAKELIEKNLYKAVIDRTYPLEKIVEATRFVESEQKIGNVVITIK